MPARKRRIDSETVSQGERYIRRSLCRGSTTRRSKRSRFSGNAGEVTEAEDGVPSPLSVACSNELTDEEETIQNPPQGVSYQKEASSESADYSACSIQNLANVGNTVYFSPSLSFSLSLFLYPPLYLSFSNSLQHPLASDPDVAPPYLTTVTPPNVNHSMLQQPLTYSLTSATPPPADELSQPRLRVLTHDIAVTVRNLIYHSILQKMTRKPSGSNTKKHIKRVSMKGLAKSVFLLGLGPFMEAASSSSSTSNHRLRNQYVLPFSKIAHAFGNTQKVFKQYGTPIGSARISSPLNIVFFEGETTSQNSLRISFSYVVINSFGNVSEWSRKYHELHGDTILHAQEM